MTREDLLERCMAGLASGDDAFVFMLHREFGEEMAANVRNILTNELGRPDIARNPDEVGGLVIDACFVIHRRAKGWRPDGAKPWTWARNAIRADIAATIGHRCIEFSDRVDRADRSADSPADASLVGGANRAAGGHSGDLEILARRHPRVRLVIDAIRSLGCERDQVVYLEYRIQQALGDPSPAATVGREFELRPENVRQIARRHGVKVGELISCDDRFSELREHGWFAA